MLPGEIDKTKLRYFLYVRKSTDEAGKQERSVEDQISDCMDLAKRKGLHIIGKPIVEKRSAKIDGGRPLFTEMIKQIRKGKADGIIAWHPDRLSRNPIDAATIVDMLDKNIIKDLAFPTCEFSNDSSGKMLLNILFAISKQYSEHISESVTRGLRKGFEEGKSQGRYVWGYIRSKETGLYEPGPYFEIVQEAWAMKENGATNAAILRFFEKNHLQREVEATPGRFIKPVKETPKAIFSNPIYYGVMEQAGQEVDLREVTGGAFQPMISYETFAKVQAMERGGKSKGGRKKSGGIFYPLKHMVTCGVCNQAMIVYKSRGGNGKRSNYLYFECRNKDCSRSPKSVRAIEIFTPLYEEIRKLQFSEEDIAKYNEEIGDYNEEKIVAMRKELAGIKAAITHQNSELEELAGAIARLGEKAQRALEKKIGKLSDEIARLEEQQKELEQAIKIAQRSKVPQEHILNLLKTLPDKMENGSAIEKDAIARLLLLNLTVDAQKRPHFLWKEPFASLLESRKGDSGGPNTTNVEPMVTILSEYLCSDKSIEMADLSFPSRIEVERSMVTDTYIL